MLFRRKRFWGAIALAVALTGGGVAVATHVPQVDPATVPAGFLATHNQTHNRAPAQLMKIADRLNLQTSVQHFQVAANEALPWHSHPGPVIVTVVGGALTYEDALRGECRRRTYEAGTGFTDPGFGHVHRAIAGPEGADFYATYLMPRRATTQTTLAEPRSACVS
jgi:hypothetical protein